MRKWILCPGHTSSFFDQKKWRKVIKYACYCFYFANLYDLKLLVSPVPSSATEISSTHDNILQTIDLLEIKHFDSSKSLLLQRSSSRMIFRIKVKTTPATTIYGIAIYSSIMFL